MARRASNAAGVCRVEPGIAVLFLAVIFACPQAGRAQDSGVARKPSKAESKAAAAERKKSMDRWKKTLDGLHDNGLHWKGNDAAKRRAKAEAELDAITDPTAVPAIWRVFGGSAAHHALVARMLGRIDTAESTRILAALSVYSLDEKARHAATLALRDRDPAAFADDLIALIQVPLKYRKGSADIPGIGRSQVLLVEDERVDYKFLYPPAEHAQAAVGKPGVYTPDNPYMTKAARAQAEAFNREQARLARESVQAQLQSDIEEVTRINLLIVEMRERAVGVLSEISGRKPAPNREAWRRWLAERKGVSYEAPKQEPKPTIAQVVPHLYQPSFITIPVRT